MKTIAIVGGLGLASLFASLLQGCCFSSTCGCDGDPHDATFTKLVSGEDFATATAMGGLTTSACTDLCSDYNTFEVKSCTDLGEVTSPGSGGAGGTGGAGGSTTAYPDHNIECNVVQGTICEGRRHAAVEGDLTGRGPTEVAAWLSRAARAEAASVHAFVELARELRGLGAPEALVAATRHAAADEVRHARAMNALASDAGAPPPPAARTTAQATRDLFALALENAVEGCVHETFAALLAMHQSRHAQAAGLRRTMAGIASDEIGHAELAWAIHRWACELLSQEQVAELRDAMRAAAVQLEQALVDEALSESTRHELGMPEPQAAAELARSAASHLWN